MFVMESAVTLTIKIMYKVFNTKYLIDIQIFYIEVGWWHELYFKMIKWDQDLTRMTSFAGDFFLKLIIQSSLYKETIEVVESW